MLIPVQCGNSDRDDILAIEKSLLQSLGSAMTDEQMSNIEIWCCAFARAIYFIWAINANASNQFDPETVDTTLSRWQAIFNLQPLPTDDLQTQRNALTEKFSLLNQIPSSANVIQLLQVMIPQVFELLLVTPAIHAVAGPGPNNVGPTINSTAWYSTTANIYIDLHKPVNMSQYQFWQLAYQVFPALNQYLPCWTEFDWFSNSFSDGYNISVNINSVDGYGSGTHWATPIPLTTDGYCVEAGSIIEFFDDAGLFHRVQVASVVSDTHLILLLPFSAIATNQPYVIQGFFCDCDSTSFPYPPVLSFNCDNAAVDDPAVNYV